MDKVFSHENLAIVNSAKNLLELNNIACFIKNEYHAAGGHVGFSAIPVELWVHDSTQAATAQALLEKELAPDRQSEAWVCEHCGEKNSGSFEVCWQCQHAPGENSKSD